MPTFSFRVVAAGPDVDGDELDDLVEALGEAGCLDATVSKERSGEAWFLAFDREADSRMQAEASARRDVESVSGFRVLRVERADW